MTYAAESEHWYARDGSPAYEVPAADGVLRPTTLRDARKLRLVPSVTTIIKAAAAPGLERWKQEQVLYAALTLPREEGEPEKEWLDRVRRDAREQARKAAMKGTAIDAAIEQHLRGEVPDPEYFQHAIGIEAKLHELFGKKMDHSSQRSFAHPMGYGGKLDFFIGPDVAVADYKSKDFGPDDIGDKRLFWDEHCLQLAAYRHGVMGQERGRCVNIFASRTHPGLVTHHEWNEEELERGWDMFRFLLHYWMAKSRYCPAF